MGMFNTVFLLLLTLLPLGAFADMESTDTLPKGVTSPKFLFGVINGLGERFDGAGLVEGVADRYTLNLTGDMLAKLNAQAATFINLLNQYTTNNEDIGSELSLGTLKITAQPVITFWAPTMSFGVTSNFSVGFGLPIISYSNNMTVSAGGQNNIAQMSNYVNGPSGPISGAFNGLAAIAANMGAALNSALATRGYLPIRSIQGTALGDLQIAGVYRYYDSDTWKLALKPMIQLPTGTKDDPNDLVDIPTGGQPAVGLYSIHDYVINGHFRLSSTAGYQLNIQDSIAMRVPDGPDDLLPGPDRLDNNISRHTGNSVFLEGGSRYKISRPLEVGLFYDMTFKDPDTYAGTNPGWNYAYLSNDTQSQVQMIKMQATFSTVDWFIAKTFGVPFQIDYVFGATVYAINAPNQTTHQLGLRMFF